MGNLFRRRSVRMTSDRVHNCSVALSGPVITMKRKKNNWVELVILVFLQNCDSRRGLPVVDLRIQARHDRQIFVRLVGHAGPVWLAENGALEVCSRSNGRTAERELVSLARQPFSQCHIQTKRPNFCQAFAVKFI